MKVLIVSYWYTPSVSPRAFRWSAIAQHWAERGAEVDVVTSWSPGLARYEVIRGVRVHRPGVHVRGFARALVQRMIRRHRPPMPTRAERSLVRASISSMPRPYKVVRWVYDRTWRQVYWPDDAGLWLFSARRAARALMRQRQYDALITVSFPFTDHLVGAGLADDVDGPWLADVGDPFCFLEHTPTNNQRLYRRLNYRADRYVFAKADAVAVTTERTAEIYAGLFPESAARIHTIPPLIPEREPAPTHPRLFEADGRIRLLFAGNLYRTIRDPDYLLRLFRALLATDLGPRLELHFMGSVRDCWSSFEPHQELIDRQLFLHGTVNHDYALQAMQEADVLVNIGNDTVYQLPSKVVEYASLGKPVLNVVRADADSSAAFFSGYRAALTVVDNRGEVEPPVVDRVGAFVRSPPVLSATEVEAFLQPYRVDSIAARYEALLARSSDPRPVPV